MKEEKQIKEKISPKDFFLNLFSMIALYVSTISFVIIIFNFIDKFFPDVIYPGTTIKNSVRWSIALLLVMFPLFIWSSRLLIKDTLNNPLKREIKIRKWLIYLTLFIAGLIITFDLSVLIYKFLGGELTIRFILKALIVLLVAFSIFVFYSLNLKIEKNIFSKLSVRVFVFSSIIIVFSSIIYGFFILGSPFQERLRKLDEKRILDLQNIQWQVINYYQKKGKLPEKLDDLNNDFIGYLIPFDPETKLPYEYKIINKTTFELCAEFKTEYKIDSSKIKSYTIAPYGVDPFYINWQHSKGKNCFQRNIEKELPLNIPLEVKNKD